MKWPRQFSLPILLGLSLTSVGIAVIYVLCKKDEDDIQSRKNRIERAKRITIEFKVPRQFIPAVIGRSGATIKDVQIKTGTLISFKEDNVECPDRICIIRGSLESVHLAEEMIKCIIRNQPVIEIYEMFVPQKAVGRIIGRGGETVQQIQTKSSARVIVEGGSNYDQNAERRITIKGTAEQIAAALSLIEDKVREEKEARSNVEASSAVRQPRGKLSPRSTKVSTQEHVQSTESSSLPVSDGLMEVYVSAAESPNQFWVQVVGPGTKALDKLVTEMTEYYSNEENHELHTLRKITLGQIVAAKFSFDDRWYRAEVTSTPEDGQCEVYFVDYGDHEFIYLDSVLELRTDFLSLRLQAIECSMANIKPRENEWSNEAYERFSDLTWLAQWRVLVAKVRGYKEREFAHGRSRREGSPIPCVDLFDQNEDKEINIGQELINEGFAEPEEALSSAASSTLSLSMKTHDIPSISSPVSSSPLAKQASTSETLLKSLQKLDSNAGASNTSVADLETDLITSEKHSESGIEEIDPVTPSSMKTETSRFIENEKTPRVDMEREDGGGDYLRSGNNDRDEKFLKSRLRIAETSRFAPAGYESDLSVDSDELELG